MTAARGIRKIITLFEPVSSLIDEADRRIQIQMQGEDDLHADTATPDIARESVIQSSTFPCTLSFFFSHDRRFAAFKLLMQLVPELEALVNDGTCTTEKFNAFVAKVCSPIPVAALADNRRYHDSCNLPQMMRVAMT